ncbi:LCP family protein [Nakamurella endophytica]|uniref:Cell envelope-related transcriptional attenuator domain-containing protein n=1 Tax=Nakamurella endophytica TaxID=1748367 RepID=A0A917T9N3_9ACTN|nr:LCP family protein [Nakamurella endophytica]GGM15564.1 hypothetical protein GCM10011594_39490 [Nakamurella endophytica]
MSDAPRDGGAADRGPQDDGGSAPWERPRLWSQPALDPDRVDDLLSRLGDDPAGTRPSTAAAATDTTGAAPAAPGTGPETGISPDTSPGRDTDTDTAPAAGRAPRPDAAAADPDATEVLVPAGAAATPAQGDPADDVGETGDTAVTGDAAGTTTLVPDDESGVRTPGDDEDRTRVLATQERSAAGDKDDDRTPLRSRQPDAGAPAGDAPDGRTQVLAGDDEPTQVSDPAEGAAGAAAVRAALSRRAASARGAGTGAPGAATAGGGTAGAAGELGEAPDTASGTGGGTVPPRRIPPTGGASGGTGGAGGGGSRRHRPWLVAGRAAVAVVAVVVLAVFGVYWNILDRADTSIQDRHVAAIDTTDSNIVQPTATGDVATTADTRTATGTTTGATTTPTAPKVYQPENILLLGSDTRAGSNASVGTDESLEDVANSDTLMIAHLSADRQKITILSIPRDTMIPAQRCRTWDANTGKLSDEDEPISEGQRWHINSAYSVGGPKCTVTAVQALTGIRIDRVIGIDFTGFKAMVDALGGIQVDICRPIVDAELSTIARSSGMQTVIGQQALDLVRARNVVGDTQSDLARIRRQQVVLSAILRQVTAAGTLLNPTKLDAFLQAFTKNTFTDNVTLQSLVDLAGSLGNLDPSHVTFYTLPTVPSETVDGALEVDEGKAPQVFDALINDLPLPGQTSTPAKTTPRSTATKPTTTRSTAPTTTRRSTTAGTPTTGSSLRATDLSSVNAGQRTCA